MGKSILPINALLGKAMAEQENIRVIKTTITSNHNPKKIHKKDAIIHVHFFSLTDSRQSNLNPTQVTMYGSGLNPAYEGNIEIDTSKLSLSQKSKIKHSIEALEFHSRSHRGKVDNSNKDYNLTAVRLSEHLIELSDEIDLETISQNTFS
jgi:hypothetical protein